MYMYMLEWIWLFLQKIISMKILFRNMNCPENDFQEHILCRLTIMKKIIKNCERMFSSFIERSQFPKIHNSFKEIFSFGKYFITKQMQEYKFQNFWLSRVCLVFLISGKYISEAKQTPKDHENIFLTIFSVKQMKA